MAKKTTGKKSRKGGKKTRAAFTFDSFLEPKDSSDVGLKKTSKKELNKLTPANESEITPKKTSKKASKKTSKKASKKTSKKASKKNSKKASKKNSKKASKKISKRITKKTTKRPEIKKKQYTSQEIKNVRENIESSFSKSIKNAKKDLAIEKSNSDYSHFNVKKNLPWVEKYRPQSTSEMVGFDSNIEKIKEFLINFETKIRTNSLNEKERAIMLEGPPGIGKTTVVYAIANDLGYDVVEMNASDARTEASIMKKIGDGISNTNLISFLPTEKKHRKKKIILIDEVDGISGQSDRGGLAKLVDLIKKTKNPIIMTCNFYDTKFKTLYALAEKIKCNNLRKPSMIKLLKRIAENEGLTIPENVLGQIAENASGDIRSAINDLQGFSMGSYRDINNLDMHRDVDEKLYEFIKSMFESKSLLEARTIASGVDFDYNILHKVVYSNLKNFLHDSEDYLNALENINLADVIIGRIRQRMDYSLLPYYFDLISGGVVFSAKSPSLKGFKRFIFPKLGNISLKITDDPVADAIQEAFKTSKLRSMLYIVPKLESLVDNAPREQQEELIIGLAEGLNISPKELKNLL